jgi:hypothetical protein
MSSSFSLLFCRGVLLAFLYINRHSHPRCLEGPKVTAEARQIVSPVSEFDFIHFLTKPMPQNRAIPCAFTAFLHVEACIRGEEKHAPFCKSFIFRLSSL